MQGVSNYRILKELRLIILFHQHSLSIEDLKILRTQAKEDKDFDPSFRILVDIRDVKIDITIKEMKSYGDWMAKNSDLLHNTPKVILTSSPKQVVMASIFNRLKRIKKYNYKIFSNLDNSLRHLDIDVEDYQFVEDEIAKMAVK